MARLWLAGESNAEISRRLGIPEVTIFDFLKPAKIEYALGFKTDPEFTDIDPPIYDVWRAKTSSNATTRAGVASERGRRSVTALYLPPARGGSLVTRRNLASNAAKVWRPGW